MKINRIIKYLIISDLALLTGIGFISPIFAIFLTQKIEGGNVQVAGFSAFIYLAVQALVMIPFSRHLDKTPGEKDDLFLIIFGNTLVALSAFGYIFSHQIWQVYLLQIIYVLGMGMNLPGYTAIFTRHIDKGKESFDWSLRSTFVTLSSGVAAATGGLIAYNFGFNVLFTAVGIFIIFSALALTFISKNLKTKNE